MTATERTVRALLVEDNPGDADLVREALAESTTAAFAVTWAKDLSQAMRLLGGVEFDVVLLDLSLPDSHGLETVTCVRAAAPQLALIVLTGLNDESGTKNPIQISTDATVLGAQVCSWAQKNKVEIPIIRKRIAAMSERTWSITKENAALPPSDEMVNDFLLRLEFLDEKLDNLLKN